MINLNNQITNIAVGKIKPNPYQPRRIFVRKSLEELSKSIRNFGNLQPISVRKISEDNYELIAGERRLRATELARLEDIPALVIDEKDKNSETLVLLENLKREDINFIEESECYHSLIKDHDFTQQELAEKLGKSQSTIANKLRILKLPTDIKHGLITSSLTERHARAMLRLPNEELQNVVLEKIIKNELTVKKTDDLIDDIIKDITLQEEKKHKTKQIIKNSMSFKIYVNTIKNAYTAIKENGVNAIYDEKDLGDCIEITVKIPKK